MDEHGVERGLQLLLPAAAAQALGFRGRARRTAALPAQVLGRPGEKDAGADSMCFPRLAVLWPWRGLQAALRLSSEQLRECPPGGATETL
jgi:hypothetical protein